MQISTTVYKRLPDKFDMCGRFLGNDLELMPTTISAGLVKRLVKYALDRVETHGFNIEGCKVEVSTTDGNDKSSHRYYGVYFINSKGGCISLNGILTRAGWPILDHGFGINVDQ